MAIMWPRQVPPDVLANPRRSTELSVYGKLSRELSDDWAVFYSRPWLGLTATGAEKDGECDFVVAHAQYGVLCLEVKGGAVAWNPLTDQWTSRDRNGITHVIKDPVAQARSCKHEVLRRLKAIRGFQRRFVIFRHGVVLPDCKDPGHDLGPDRPSRVFCFSDKYRQQFSDWIRDRFRQDRDSTQEQELGVDGLHALQSLLAQPLRLELSLGAAVCAEDQHIDYLTQQQFHLLDAIRGLPRVLIHGGAGTGKTVLAARLAQDLAGDGKRTLLVCYNRPLAVRLAAQAEASKGLTVQSFHQLCNLVIKQAGHTPPDEGHNRQSFFDSVLPAAADACSSSPAVLKYDAVIVDEGQDFRDLWWLVIDSLLSTEGPRLLRVFADNNQRLYTDIGQLGRDMQLAPIALSWNLRNTKAIHEAAYRHYQGAFVRCDGPDGEAPVVVEATDPARVGWHVVKVVQSLTKQRDLAPENVAILVPSDSWRTAILADVSSAGFGVTDASDHQEGKVTLDTVRRFKGLESVVTVIVADADLAASKELSYIAVSRGRTRLYLVGSPRHTKAVLALESG